MEVPVENSTVASPTPPKKPRNHRKAPVRIDKRFILGKRITQLSAIYAERAGLDATDPDPVLKASIEKAAMLTGLAEDAAHRAARGDPKIALDDVVRLTRLADLTVRRLHLDRRKPASPTLASYLAQRGDRP